MTSDVKRGEISHTSAYIPPPLRRRHDHDIPPPKRIKHESPPSSSSPPPPPPKQSIQLSLSGTLASHALTTPSGSTLKYHPPADSALPTLLYRLYVFSPTSEGPVTLHLHRQATYGVGRDAAVNDVVISHPSVSKQHAVLQYRRVKGVVKPYVIDLGSVNGTFLNGKRVDNARFVELRERDVLTFGTCGKDYVLLHAESGDTEGVGEGKGKAKVEEKEEKGERKEGGDVGGAVKKKNRPAWASDDDEDF